MFHFNTIEDKVYFQSLIIGDTSLQDLQQYLRKRHRVNMPLVFVLQLVLVMRDTPFSANTTRIPKIQKDLDEKVNILINSLVNA